MTKLLFSFSLFIFSSISFACEIEFPEQMLLLGREFNLATSVKNQNCSEQELNDISSTLQQVEGKITANHLDQMLNGKVANLTVKPHVFQIKQIKQIIHEQINMPSGIQLKSSEAMNRSNFLALNPGDRIEVQCIGCVYGSGQHLNLRIHSFDGNERNLIVRADFTKMVKAYRLQTSANAFIEVPVSSLKEEYVESIPHTDLVTDLATLRFFKLNKPVRAGTLLRKSDLNAINLVRAGLKTEVIMENSLIKIKTSGISRNSGGIGEMVEVFHPQKNKKYLGKVIDINKVLVEL